MPKFSVAICCANMADSLPAACESAKWADELVIVDSGSTDGTAEIARQYADRYVEEPWRGYRGQKMFAAELCRNDWVIILDADEEITPKLAEQLQAMSDGKIERYDVIRVPRRNYIFGRWARAWSPDWQDRIIHRKRCRWPQEVLHERREPGEPGRLGTLKGHLTHKRTSEVAWEDYFSGVRLDSRLMMVARDMHDRGKRCHWWDLAFRPPFTIFKLLFLKLGILDGAFGILIAQKTAVTTQLKYAALWAVQNEIRAATKNDESQS